MHRRNRWVATGFLVIAAGLTACGPIEARHEVSEQGPAQVEPIKGTELNRVTLTPLAAQRLGIMTEAVRGSVVSGGAARDTLAVVAVPLAAVLYDKDGNTWVYVVKELLTYERQVVSIARVDGNTAVLDSGPAVGTEVVTVGIQELLGAELGVAGE